MAIWRTSRLVDSVTRGGVQMIKRYFGVFVMVLALAASATGFAAFDATDLDGTQAIITAFLAIAVVVNIALTTFFVGKKGSSAARRA